MENLFDRQSLKNVNEKIDNTHFKMHSLKEN